MCVFFEAGAKVLKFFHMSKFYYSKINIPTSHDAGILQNKLN